MSTRVQNFINNSFLPAQSELNIPSLNPASASELSVIPDSDDADVKLAVDAARAAFKSWSKTTRSYRSAILLKIADLIESRLEEFAIAESKDQGKPISLARTVDIPRAIYNFRFFATYILHLTTPASDLDGIAINYVHSYPVGVAGLISPWNLPLYLLTWKIAPAIAYGCTCVCKPSEFTSLTAYLLCSVFLEAKLPSGVVNMVFGTGPKAGNALVVHPKVPLISFTGGTATGQIIYRNAALFFKKLSLELGGKNANIIFSDCEFDKAVETSIRSSFSNQGEICLCGSRIYVQEDIFDKFVEKLVEKANALIVGDPLDPKTQVGAIVSEQHMNKILTYIQLAKDEGGKIHCGGSRVTELLPGYFIRPTIISNLLPTSRVCREEIFGPVVTINKFKTEDEVLEYANDLTDYGLSASVWTRDGEKAQRIARVLEVGTVWVNCWMVRDLNMPFGGTKSSGIGREGGKYSREFFCEEKTICISHKD